MLWWAHGDCVSFNRALYRSLVFNSGGCLMSSLYFNIKLWRCSGALASLITHLSYSTTSQMSLMVPSLMLTGYMVIYMNTLKSVLEFAPFQVYLILIAWL